MLPHSSYALCKPLKSTTVQERRPIELGPFLEKGKNNVFSVLVEIGTQVQNSSMLQSTISTNASKSTHDVLRSAEEDPAIIRKQFAGVALAFLVRLRTSLPSEDTNLILQQKEHADAWHTN